MMPMMSIHYLAVLACAVVAMPIGFLWFGPLFGKTWVRHMGMGDMPSPDAASMGKSMAIFFAGNLLIAWVLAHSIEAWQASSWGLTPDAPPWTYAVSAGFFNWLGFFLPVQMNRVAWEKKSWGLVLINASFDLTRLMLFGFILSYWQ
ncbi:MAG: DUF1761 domain-containing protein [Vicinamibacterales bacterium]